MPLLFRMKTTKMNTLVVEDNLISILLIFSAVDKTYLWKIVHRALLVQHVIYTTK